MGGREQRTVPPELEGEGGSVFGGPYSGRVAGLGAAQPPLIPALGTPNALGLPPAPTPPRRTLVALISGY